MSEMTTDLRGTAKATRCSMLPWFVWGLGASFFLSEYFARVAPSVMIPELMRDLHVSAFALGSLSAFFYYAYVGMQIPVGMLVDRFGPHRLLTASSALCAAGCFLFGKATNVLAGEVGRLLIGFGAAFAFVGTLKLASVWFPSRRFGLLAGMTQALGMWGAVIGVAPMSVAVTFLGWRSTMTLVGSVFVVLAILIGLVVRDHPEGVEVRKQESSLYGMWEGLIKVLRNPQSWVNGLYVGLLFAPTAAFGELWGVTVLTQIYHLTKHTAATCVAMIFVGWGCGAPLVGWLSDYYKRRKPLLILSPVFGLVLLSLIVYLPIFSVSALFLLLFLYGVSNSSVAISYAVANEINVKPLAGTSMAFANMSSVVIGALLQPVIGGFLDLMWNGALVEGVRAYSTVNYQKALLILPLCLIGAAIASCFIRETHCRRIDDPNQ